MIIVPVIDLCDGIVVHAIKGTRQNYLPIDSALSNTADVFDVISGMLNVHNFKQLYIADLNALERRNDNSVIIKKIIQTYPQLEVWLDTGVDLISLYKDEIKYSALRIILSTESINSESSYAKLMHNHAKQNVILSIDYRAGKLLGPSEISQNPAVWPDDIIILNLDVVGSNEGIKIPLALKHLSFNNKHNVFYGGGIKNSKDLRELNSLGMHGALLSTALHNKNISANDLLNLNRDTLADKKMPR